MQALIVDDSRAMRAIIAKILRELGFGSLQASNGCEALDLLKQGAAVDVVFVDWNMPEMNGLEFIRRVRSDRSYDGLPLILVTTETELQNVIQALDCGANEYVMKPFTPNVIVEKLEMLGVHTV